MVGSVVVGPKLSWFANEWKLESVSIYVVTLCSNKLFISYVDMDVKKYESSIGMLVDVVWKNLWASTQSILIDESFSSMHHDLSREAVVFDVNMAISMGIIHNLPRQSLLMLTIIRYKTQAQLEINILLMPILCIDSINPPKVLPILAIHPTKYWWRVIPVNMWNKRGKGELCRGGDMKMMDISLLYLDWVEVSNLVLNI